MTMLMMQQFKNTCDVCLVGESSCCNMTTKQKPDKTKFKMKCKNCEQPCLDCYEKSFLQEAPKKNKFKRKAFQPNDLSQMSEKTAEKVRETYEVFLKEGKLPKEEGLDVDPRKDRKMKKKKDKKNKKKPYKCFDKKCDVCRNSSCCSYKDERANNMKVLNFECRTNQQCQLTELQQCVDCYNYCFDSDVTIPTNDVTVTESMTSLFTVKYVKSSFGGKKMIKKNMLEEYFEKDSSKIDLEKFLMKKAKKHQKKINKKLNKKKLKKQKKYKTMVSLRSEYRTRQENSFDKTE